jgi:outer membrane receptor protein involved in Fe transport
MFQRTKVNAGVLLALGTALLGAGMAAHAQTSDRVEITGSRIKSVGNTSSSPISSVGRADIDTTQPVAVEELLRSLPAAYPAIGPSVNNGSNGTASIDLRGMGSNRTLVLLNGKRIVPATLGGVVDTNNVPVSLLERVDLVTGGASAVYGADAVAGVVNFVTKRNFTGVEASTLYSVSAQNDAKRYKSDLTIGSNLADGRGNVALHVGRTRTEALRLADRNYAGTVISSSSGNAGGFSSTSVPALWGGIPTLSGNRVIDSTTGLLRAANGAAPPDGYNTNPPNYFETPLTRTQVTGLGRFVINDNAEAYAEIFHTRSNVTLNLAPSGTFGSSLLIPIGNPYITDPVRQQLCTAYGISAANCVAGNATEFRASISRRFVEAGPRIYSYDNVSTQYTVGLRGSLPVLDTWSYEAYYQSGRSDQQQTTANGFSASKLQQAVRATNTTSCTVTTGGCVPVNLFGAAGTLTPAMLDFLRTPTFQTTLVQQSVTSLSVNGDLGAFKSPLAKRAIGLALGAEQRTVFGGNKSDAVVQTQGELLGSGSPTPDRSGTIKFNEYYGEANVPLLEGLQGARSVNLAGGYRQTEFKTSAASQTYGSWKAGLDWTPIKGLRFRGEQQRATRAPNVNELYAPVTTAIGTLSNDPCQGTQIGAVLATDSAAVAANKPALTALCQQTGITAAQVGTVPAPSSNQAANTSGGNPNLKPEKADTTTIGFVWEPEFVDNLAFNVDFWRIKIKGAVASPTLTQVTSGCYSAAQNPTFSYNALCGLINRDPLSGGLSVRTGFLGVVTQSSNLGEYDYSGYDVGVTYRLALAKVGMPTMGRLDVGLQAALIKRADVQTLPSLPVLSQAGYYGVDVGTPYSKTRFSQRTTWAVGDVSLGYNWRYIGGAKVQAELQGSYQSRWESIPSVNYFDLNGTWQAMKNLKLSLTINNALNKKPPFIGTGIGPSATNYGNTFPSAYDVVGRRYTMNATATF